MSRTVRPTRPDGPPAPDKNQQRLCTILSLSQIERRTVRDLVREHVFTQHGPRLTGGRSATRSAVQTGQSAHSTRTVRDLVREHVFTQHGPHLTGGRSASWSAVQTRQSAPLTRTARPCLFITHSRTHEQPTHAPYVQPLYHILALFLHVSSCHLPIIAYIHDILIIKHHVHSCRDRDAGARRG